MIYPRSAPESSNQSFGSWAQLGNKDLDLCPRKLTFTEAKVGQGRVRYSNRVLGSLHAYSTL